MPPPETDVPRIVAVGLLTSGQSILVAARPDRAPLRGQWKFPGGKVEFGEHPWDALRRELREDLGARAIRGDLFGVYSRVYDVEGLRAHYVFVASHLRIGRHRIPETSGLRWVTLAQLRRLPVLPGSRPIVADLARRRPVRV